MKKVYITRRIPEAGLKILRDNGIEFDMADHKFPPTQKQVIKNLKKYPYDGVINFLTDKIDKNVFDACPTAKVFANFSVGFDNVDLEEAKKRCIEITNTPGTSAVAVAEHTVALMFALSTRLVEGDLFVRAGKYKGWDPNLFIGTDIKGKTVGLIGGGQIGTKVAQMLHNGFDVNIIYNDVNQNKELEETFHAIRKEFIDLIKEADIISLHVPLLPSTKHLINKEVLSQMKNTAFLINTARGAVIDEKALLEALKAGTIRGAGLDVYEFEPKITKGLNKLSSVVLTPHIASSRQSARDAMAETAAKNIVEFLTSGQVLNSCHK